MEKTSKNVRSPWAWIPTLYFAEGLPYVAVMTISVIMYKRMGISNTDIALYTSWLYLPWVIKPFWSPFVDLLKTKHWWIVSMQLLIGAGMAGIAFTIPLPFFFQATLAFFWLMAFSSATHDIAADGFYMLALDNSSQAKYVGIRSTFYRLATIAGQGLLIILAGFIESSTRIDPLNIQVEVSPRYTFSGFFEPEIYQDVDEKELRFVTGGQIYHLGTQLIPKDSFTLLVNKVKEINRENGIIPYDMPEGSPDNISSVNWWTFYVSRPLGGWIKNTFGEDRKEIRNDSVGNVGIVPVRLSGKLQGEKQVILNISQQRGDRSIHLICGERLVFNKMNRDKTAYLAFQVDSKLQANSFAGYKGLSGNIPFSWSVVFFVLAGLFLFFSFWHKLFLPRPSSDKTHINIRSRTILKEFIRTFASFFRKPQAAAAIFFMLTFRFSEAQALKLITPFLLDSREVGGLGLTTGEVGWVYGTIGITGLTLGGIAGGLVAAKGGLKKWLWPMSLSMLLTTLAFVYLSFSQTGNFFVINVCVFIEQLGYGFGFTAYMLYLMYYSDGKYKTAHYAICTGFMALGMMIPGMFAGWMQELLGYNRFFIWVMVCSIIPVIAISLLKINREYGKTEIRDNK